jgi:hypothetical protein
MSTGTIALASVIAAALAGSPADELASLPKPALRGNPFDDSDLKVWQAEWEAKREKLWAPLLRRAGRPREGMVLRAWLQPPSAAVGRPVRLILSLANLRDEPVAARYAGSVPREPEVFARGPAGEVVKLTKAGAFRSAWVAGWGGPPPTLPPGCAVGSVLELQDAVRLDKPGRYSVIVAQELQGDLSGIAVSQVLPLELRPPTAADLAEKADRPGAQGATLLPEARRTLGGCVLEAVSPPSPGPPRLVVSLTCLSDRLGGGDEVFGRAIEGAGGKPTDYNLVVRDAAGNPVPMNERGQKAYAAAGYRETRVLRMGDAVGAIVPLADWFDLSKPGEYTVLVSITAPDNIGFWTKNGLEWRPGPTWVAKPVKITVPAAPK